MKWSIRNQILIPVSVIFILGIVVSTWVNVKNLRRFEQNRIRLQIKDLVSTVTEKSFPLNDSVLRQIEMISGIHLIVISVSDSTTPDSIQSSFSDYQTVKNFADQLFVENSIQTTNFLEFQESPDGSNLPLRVRGKDQAFLVWVHPITHPNRQLILFGFYPEDQLNAAISQAVIPQMITGAITLVIVVGLIVLISGNVTKPIEQLKLHVAKIAKGNFVQSQVNRTDEIGKLLTSINQMSSQLADYEERIRRQEKIFTLDQMGGGIAHQLRNSITGCRLALDFHREKCDQDPESLDVAIRQLIYMEDFQKRFLAIARESELKLQLTNFGELIAAYLPLMEPVARHVAVNLDKQLGHESQKETIWIWCDRDRMEQVLNNLIINAIEAASGNMEIQKSIVSVVLTQQKREEIHPQSSPSHQIEFPEQKGYVAELLIRDNGKGVVPEIAGQLFDALATTKPDGVGLGLAIAKQTVEQHHGRIFWNCIDGYTEFRIQLPLAENNPE